MGLAGPFGEDANSSQQIKAANLGGVFAAPKLAWHTFCILQAAVCAK
jgi:hypothetical protein